MKDMLIAGGTVQVIKCIAAHIIVCQHIDCHFQGGATQKRLSEVAQKNGVVRQRLMGRPAVN